MHKYKNRPDFNGADIARCYDELHIAKPSGFGGFLTALEGRGLLRGAGGYRLDGNQRDIHHAKYGQTKHKIAVTNLLKDLPAKLPDLAERKYLDEALICYENEAFRAAVVMVWNLAYAHLCDHVLKNRLADFNARWKISYPGMHKTPKQIAVMDDFNEFLKEHEVLQICRDANIITKNVYNALEPGLKKRNMAAHPNNVIIDQAVLDGIISDVINNAVLQI